MHHTFRGNLGSFLSAKQQYMLRWIGSNEDRDFLRDAFASSSFPPKRQRRPDEIGLLLELRSLWPPIVHCSTPRPFARFPFVIGQWHNSDILVT